MTADKREIGDLICALERGETEHLEIMRKAAEMNEESIKPDQKRFELRENMCSEDHQEEHCRLDLDERSLLSENSKLAEQEEKRHMQLDIQVKILALMYQLTNSQKEK